MFAGEAADKDFGTEGTKIGEIEEFFSRTDTTVWAEVNKGPNPRRGYRFTTRVPVPDAVSTLWRNLLADLQLDE